MLYYCCTNKRPFASNPVQRFFACSIILLIAGVNSWAVQAQETLTSSSVTKIATDVTTTLVKKQHTEVDIKIDGLLDEAVWSTLPYMDDFVVIDPDTLVPTEYRTEAKLFYTEKGLYIGVHSEQPKATLISRLSSRDDFIPRDTVSVTLDPGGSGLYGYWFAVNLGGSLQDGTVLPERQYSSRWDGPWNGASAEVEGGYDTEFFIPWSMMTMPESANSTRNMGVYFSRSVAHKNERWAIPALPSTTNVFLSKLRKLRVEGVNPKQQFTFYPYASTTYNNLDDTDPDSYKAGFDVFWRPTTNLQLTATVNPDFGNVECDKVDVNLSSFETFFPEKRAFFLEGNEVFDATPRARRREGTPTTLVNTRRIGSAPIRPDIDDFELESVERNQPTELFGAAKVTGQNGKVRYGILTAFEEDTLLEGELDSNPFSVVQDGRNFGIGRVLYEDTSTGARRGFGWLGTVVDHPQSQAMVHSLDGHYLSRQGNWNTDAQFMFSDVDDTTGAGGFVDVQYNPAQGREHSFSFDYYDEDLEINDLGFLQRNDLVGVRYNYERNESGFTHIKSRETSLGLNQQYNTDGKTVRSALFSSQERLFNNNNFLVTEFKYLPSRWDDVNSGGNGAFKIDSRVSTGFFYGTDRSKKLSTEYGLFYEDEDIGGRTLKYRLNVTWRPTDRFSLSSFVTYEDKKGWLIHDEERDFTTFNTSIWRPRIEASFFLSARQQFKIKAQWAGIKAFEDQRWTVPIGDGDLIEEIRGADDLLRDFSISRLTFQARYRWEIAPLSDLFVVYTRGSNVDSRPQDSFSELIRSSWSERLVDVFVVKLRYRIGN